MNVFEAVKQNVTTRQAAELYGIRVGRNGMAVCPFHNDKNPSMKLDRRFHCFGCQADGDAVDFVSRLFGLPSKEAAMKIADDFGISYDSRQKPSIRPKIREPTPEQKYQQEENHCYKMLSDYFHLLRKWEKQYAPQRTDEVWHGYRCSGSSVTENDCIEVIIPSGTPVLSVLDGHVVSVSSGVVTLQNEKGYTVKIGGCTSISVAVGVEVTKGQPIAAISSAGRMTLAFSYRNTNFNPYFYLDCGSIVDSLDVEATGKAAKLIAKAEQYLGTPYVWGGYSPGGFDCSGFVSYAVNNCGAGFNFGRLTAESWHRQCTTISASQARPGDLIFFQGTYNTSGASHVGIYLGDGMMIHCGSPVKISSINTVYWQQHFYCYGRIPGM